MKLIEDDLLADWARLGVLWNVPASSRIPDVECLIIDSLSFVRGNARLLVLMTTWLSIFWRLVDRERLLSLAVAASPFEQATLGLVLETAQQWVTSPVFAVVTSKLAPLTSPRPLFEADQGRPALTRLAELEASAIARRWGLWCMPILQKPKVLRPESWVLDANPLLARRAEAKPSVVAVKPVVTKLKAE
jgi:hypothetical protein